MNYTVHNVTFGKDFKSCPLCRYGDGFHTMLSRDGQKIRWLFICPSCREVFDIGQTVKE